MSEEEEYERYDLLSASDSDSDFTDDSSDSERDEWHEVKLNRIRSVRISFDALQKTLLERVEQEWGTVLHRLREKVYGNGHAEITVSTVLDVMLRQFMEFVLEHVNAVFTRKGVSKVRISDVVAFFRVELMCAHYRVSPTALYDSPYTKLYAQGIMDKTSYSKIDCALQEPFEDVPAFRPHPRLSQLEELLAKVNRFCFDINSTIAANDDDKLPISGARASSFGLVAKKIKKNFGPIVHITASVLTSLFVCSVIEHSGDSVLHCVQAGLVKMCQARKLEDVKLDNLFTRDRGYNMKKVSDSCLQLGLHELGTRKRERNFVFTFKNNPTNSQRRITEKGSFGAYFAKRSPNIPGRSNVRLYGVAARDNGRVVMLTTSKPEYGLFQINYITKRQPKDWSIEYVVRPGPGSNIARDMQQQIDEFVTELPGKVRILTSTQRDPSWFLLRKFRITSSVSSRFIAKWLSSLTNPDIDSIPRLREVMRMIGYRIASQVDDSMSEQRQRHFDLLMKGTKAHLQQLCENFADPARSRTALSITGNKPVLANRLLDAGFNPVDEGGVDAHKSVERLLHECWFMAPVNGTAMRDGSANEETIITRLPKFFEKHSKGECELLAVREYGLIASLNKPWLATSVDGICFLKTSVENEPSEMIPFIGEWKTRSAHNSVDKITSIRESYGRLISIKLNGQSDSQEKFHKVVPDRSYRQQLLHHCATLGMTHVMYVESTVNRIEYVVLLEFLPDTLTAYIESCVAQMEPYMKPFHELSVDDSFDTVQPMISKLEGNFGYAVDEDTYRLTVAMWWHLVHHVESSGKPLPACNSIRPAMVSAWNSLKGGVDVFSRLLANCRPNHGRRRLYGSLYSRAFFTLIVNSHLLCRAHRVLGECNQSIRQRFATYHQFKKHLSNLGTISSFCAEAEGTLPYLAKRWCASAQNPDSLVDSALSDNRITLHRKRKLREDFATHPSDLFALTSAEHLLVSGSSHSSRCIVCCDRCRFDEDGRVVKHHVETSQGCRTGYKTKYGCRTCFVAHKKLQLPPRQRRQFKPEENPGLVPLCGKARFPGDNRTCFQIHHQCKGNYPNCPPPPPSFRRLSSGSTSSRGSNSSSSTVRRQSL